MKDKLISFSTAKLAKEKGFNVKCDNHYGYCPNHGDGADWYFNVGEPGVKFISVPTQSLLQKWLREVHSIHINIGTIAFNRGINKMPNYGYCISSTKNHNKKITNYEKVLEKALKQALKFI